MLRVEVMLDDIHTGLSLPKDLPAVEELAAQEDVALLLLDPLMSRIDEKLDTHRDAETRRALEPIAGLAHRANLAVLGLIHHNKSGSNDPLQLVMASKAFTAVPRSVHTVVPDPENPERRLFGTSKNNLGRTDLPTLVFTMASHPIDTDEGTAWVGRIVWEGTSDTSISEAMQQPAAGDDYSATGEAQNWLEDYLTMQGGTEESKTIKAEGKKAGHNESALHRARVKLRLTTRSEGMPRHTSWSLPDAQSETPPSETWPPPSTCAHCGEPMTRIYEGQTMHPNCEDEAA